MNRLLSILCLVMIALLGIKQSAFGESSSNDSAIHLSIHITPGNINAKVGESGKLVSDDFQDVPLKGSFLEMTDNPYIQLGSDGSWKALKSGETELTPVFTLSQETMNELENKFPGKKITQPDMKQSIPISITNKSTTMPNDSKHNTSNNQSLPSANEANHSKSIVFFGILIIILIVLFYGKIKNS